MVTPEKSMVTCPENAIAPGFVDAVAAPVAIVPPCGNCRQFIIREKINTWPKALPPQKCK